MEPGSRGAGKPESRKTGKPEDQKTSIQHPVASIQHLILYLNYNLYLYRNAAGKLIHPHGSARMFAALTEYLYE